MPKRARHCILGPAALAALRVDDGVLVEWRGNLLLHLIKEIKDDQLRIGNNLGKTNGWVKAAALLGKVVAVE